MRRLEPEEIENQHFPIARRGYEKDKVDSFLRVVAGFYRGALRAAEAVETKAAVLPERVVPEAPAPRRSFDRLGDQIAAVLATAEQAAQELKANADREVQQMRRAAADEAAETTQAATNQLALARQLKANAQQEAESTLADARDEASRTKQEANVVAARLEQNARERATKVEQEADGKLEDVVAEARRRYEQLSSASQKSVDHILSVEAVLRKAREGLTLERLTTKVADYPPDEPAGLGSGRKPHDEVGAPGARREGMETEPVVMPPEGEPAFSAVATYSDDTTVDDALREAEAVPDPPSVKPAPPRRRGPGTGARTRSTSRRAGPRSVPSANSSPPPDQA